MKPVAIGLALGALAGVLDVLPMIAQGLPWDADVSAFSMWVVIGFFLAVTKKLPMPSPVQGILTAFLCLVPSAVLIGRNTPVALVPIAVMTTLLGAALGYAVHRFSGRGRAEREPR